MRLKIIWQKNKDAKKRNTTLIGNFLLIFVGVLIAIVLGELGLRYFFSLPLETEYLRFSCNNYEKIPRQNSDRDLFWKPTEEFRKVKYSLEKGKDTVRIICIGDSITQGDAQEKGLLPLEQTYVYKLQKLLASVYRKKRIEVINAGRGGYSSLQGLRYLKKSLWQYKPDLIISWFGCNDYYTALFFSDKEQNIDREGDVKQANILQRSKLFLFFKNFALIKQELKNPRVRVPPEDFYDNCEEMIKFSKEKGFEIVFVAPFHIGSNDEIEYFAGYPEKLEALKRKYGCSVLYLKQFFAGKDLKEFYSDSCHFNNKGNALVSDILFELLEDKWKYLALRRG